MQIQHVLAPAPLDGKGAVLEHHDLAAWLQRAFLEPVRGIVEQLARRTRAGRSSSCRYCRSVKVTWPCWRCARAAIRPIEIGGCACRERHRTAQSHASEREPRRDTGVQRLARPLGSAVAVIAPEVEEIEPVVRVTAAILLPAAGHSGRSPRALPLRASRRWQCREVGERREYDVVAITAAVEAEHEDHRAAQQRRHAHRTVWQAGGRAEEAHRLRRLIAQRAIAEHSRRTRRCRVVHGS